jgi:hypothetical protein
MNAGATVGRMSARGLLKSGMGLESSPELVDTSRAGVAESIVADSDSDAESLMAGEAGAETSAAGSKTGTSDAGGVASSIEHVLGCRGVISVGRIGGHKASLPAQGNGLEFKDEAALLKSNIAAQD